jgi:dienelactone hydrolase
LLSVVAPVSDERRKQLAALHRSVPVTRMVDYGVSLGDAIALHEITASERPPDWDDACEELALRHIRLAEECARANRRLTAAQAWRAASALLQCAHLAYNADGSRKKALYSRAAEAMRQHAALCDDLVEIRLQSSAGSLHGWAVSPRGSKANAAVVVLGGLSGWGASYLDMGRALAARGILAVLAEGPGQGLSRMQEGMHLDASTLPLLSRFLDYALDHSAERLGVWGNSFGGLFAAQLAVQDARVLALCINGAPMMPTVPTFRTAREQMAAVLGTTSEAELADRLRAIALEPSRHRTEAAMLVVQGGRDAMVPIGSQDTFFTLSPRAAKSTLTWLDGDHTIYNHAHERNDRVSDWFAQELCPCEPNGPVGNVRSKTRKDGDMDD